ncbi:hypothetical protein E6O75_ATG01167 [Venturia nashicola]|uniref:F-box domain-containing protein n=1 Tax=Venturia nashicola TaxID=86259 RepID=A0A4Z1PG71_9PEZI|nr:hypothetical protein E6O75_ATG01167 [Venturia nashicola]
MDSIFSTPKGTEEEVTTGGIGFLDLPGELRNQIYSLLFAPATPELRLFPSVECLNSLVFLYTCRQIHWEARHLAHAHALCYTATNRWHRHDLVQMAQTYNRLPPMLQAFISSLELQTQWRLPHKDAKPGNWRFFDCFVDCTGWIWDCVELFSGVKALKIVHTWQVDMDGLSRLKHCLENDIYLPVGPRASDTEPKNWRLETKNAGSGNKITKLFLIGMNERHGRRVEIECVASQARVGS